MKDSSEFAVSADSIYTRDGLMPHIALRIRDGRIHVIENVHSVGAHIKLCHFPGCTITPCFCDYHLHFFQSPSGEEKKCIHALITHGVTSAWDGGGPDGHGLAMREKIKNKFILRSAGFGIYKKGTYGKQIGMAVESVKEAKEGIDRLAEARADYIKIINSGIFLSETGRISAGGFQLKELDHIVSYAKTKGFDVFCHANGRKAIEDAVITEVSAIIHGLHISDRTLDVMSEKDIAFIPTIHAFRSLRKISRSGKAVKNIDVAVGHHLSAIHKAEERGVKILAGSDAGPSFIPHGESYIRELEMFRKAGLSVQSIISSSSQGFIEEGMKADFLVLDGLTVKKVFMYGKPVIIRKY